MYTRALLSAIDPHIFYALETLGVCYNFKDKYDIYTPQLDNIFGVKL